MTVIGDVTMVTELQGGSGAYSTDNVVAVVVHCASSKKKKKKRSRSIILYILLLIQITVIPWGAGGSTEEFTLHKDSSMTSVKFMKLGHHR